MKGRFSAAACRQRPGGLARHRKPFGAPQRNSLTRGAGMEDSGVG